MIDLKKIQEKESELGRLRRKVFHCEEGSEEQKEIIKKIDNIKKVLLPYWNMKANEVKSDNYLRAYQ